MPPVVDDSFEWTPASWGWALRCRLLRHVRHGWTTRQLQLRGTPEIEHAGWAAVAGALDLEAVELVRLRQVHGAAVFRVANGPSGVPEADIALSARSGRGIVVQVADCVPLLMADERGALVAASHAGWRGTAADVAGVSVRQFIADGVEPARLRAALGPSIGPCCYQVGVELKDAFVEAGWTVADVGRWFIAREGRLFFDLWRANADQLGRAGLSASQIFVSRLCTACHPQWFYSYRRDGVGTGRLAGYIRASGP